MEQLVTTVQELVAAYGWKVVAAIVIFILGRWIAKGLRSGLVKAMQKGRVDETLRSFLGSALYVSLMASVVLAVLNQLGVQTTSFIAVIGAAGLAIALAFQNSLSNLSAGVMLIVFRPLKPGDFIESAGISGIVETIEIFTTILRTVDNKVIFVPNSKLVGDTITNYSVKETRRIDLVIGVGYDDDLATVKGTLGKILADDERVLADPAPSVALMELGESSVDFAVRPWVKAADFWTTRSDLLERIKIEFDTAGISIPYPQRDLHVHSTDPAHAA